MISLKQFRRALTAISRLRFALRVHSGEKMIEQVAYGGKPPNAELCMRIEVESGGLVRCETLRPDLIELWTAIRNPRVDLAHVNRTYELQEALPVPLQPGAPVPAPSLRLS